MAQTLFNFERTCDSTDVPTSIEYSIEYICKIEKPRPDLLTLSTTFYDLSVRLEAIGELVSSF